MNIKNDDIITFDGKKVLILTTFDDSGKNYAFGNVITDDEEDVTDIYLLFEVGINNALTLITDEPTLTRLSDKVQTGLEQAFADVDLEEEGE